MGFKEDQLRALREARQRRPNPFEDAARGRDPQDTKKGLRIKSKPKAGPVGDGIALIAIAHPPGLIDKMADAIRSGKLSLKRGRPPFVGERPWVRLGMSRRTWYRRQKEGK